MDILDFQAGGGVGIREGNRGARIEETHSVDDQCPMHELAQVDRDGEIVQHTKCALWSFRLTHHHISCEQSIEGIQGQFTYLNFDLGAAQCSFQCFFCSKSDPLNTEVIGGSGNTYENHNQHKSDETFKKIINDRMNSHRSHKMERIDVHGHKNVLGHG